MGIASNYLPDWLPEDPSKNDAARQGLLAFAGSMLNSRGGFLNGLGNGLVSGGAGYNSALAQQQQQALRDEQFKQTKLENQKLQGQLDEPMQLAAILGGNGQPGAAPSITPRSALPQIGAAPAQPGGPSFNTGYAGAPQSMPSAPQPQQQAPAPAVAPGDLYQTYLGYGDRLTQAGKPAAAKQYYDLAEKLKPRYATDFRVAQGDDGKLHNYLVAEDGTFKDVGLGVKPDMVATDTGGKVVWSDKNAIAPGSSLTKTQTPDSIAGNATQIKIQNMITARQEAADKGEPEAKLAGQELQMMAEQYLAGDKGAMQNLGRGRQGAENIIALRREITRQATAAGLNGADIAAKMADFEGLKVGLRTSANISARVENAISEAKELAPLAIAASKDVTRSGLLPFGKAQIMFDTQTNDPALKKFVTANNGLVAAYAGAMARGQKPTVSDYEHARHILAEAQSQKAYEATVSQMFSEMEAASRAPQNVRDHLRNQITGKDGESHTPAAKPAITPLANVPKKTAPAGHPDDINNLLNKYGKK